jgi:4-amino-4-deoxy-L-arabinose transferase-like glycosyltransferase
MAREGAARMSVVRAAAQPSWRRPFRTLTDSLLSYRSLTGDTPSDAAVALLVAGWTVILWFWAVLSHAPGGLFFDFLEAYAWSTGFAWSSPRHPPMIGWLTGLWFSVMPRNALSFLTLGTLATGVTLWVFYLLFKRILPPQKRVAALALTALVPMLAPRGFYFNANTLQAPFWTLATLFFLQSFETRRAPPAALAGLAAAGAVLTKYFGGFLPMGLAVATLVHPDRWRYWRSPAPYLSVAVFALVLVPHLLWVLGHELNPLTFVSTAHSAPLGEAIRNAVKFVLLVVPAWSLLPVVAFLAIVRPSRAEIREIVAPGEPTHRLWLAIFVLTIVIAAAVCAALSQIISNPWIYPAFSLLAPILLAPASLEVSAKMRARLVLAMLGFALLLAAAAPGLAILRDLYRAPSYTFTRLIAPAVEAEWERRFGERLAYAGGERGLAYGLAFYGSTGARSFPDLDPDVAPWIDEADVARRGMVVLCTADDEGCLARMGAALAGGSGAVMDFTVRARFLRRDHVSPMIRVGFVPPVP